MLSLQNVSINGKTSVKKKPNYGDLQEFRVYDPDLFEVGMVSETRHEKQRLADGKIFIKQRSA